MNEPVTINTRKLTIETSPEVTVHLVELERDGSIWRESFGSKELNDAFVRGVMAGFTMATGDVGYRFKRTETVERVELPKGAVRDGRE